VPKATLRSRFPGFFPFTKHQLRTEEVFMEDRRSEARWPTENNVLLQVLGRQRLAIPAQLRDYSDRGAGVGCGMYVAPGTLVRLDFEDELWLGEVVHCERTHSDYTLGLRVEQRLANLRELHSRFQRLDERWSQCVVKTGLMQNATR
jgi:hypothetical protein